MTSSNISLPTAVIVVFHCDMGRRAWFDLKKLAPINIYPVPKSYFHRNNDLAQLVAQGADEGFSLPEDNSL